MLGGLPTPGFAASPPGACRSRACRPRRAAYRVKASSLARARPRGYPARYTRAVNNICARALALPAGRVREPGRPAGAGKAADPPVMLSSS